MFLHALEKNKAAQINTKLENIVNIESKKKWSDEKDNFIINCFFIGIHKKFKFSIIYN